MKSREGKKERQEGRREGGRYDRPSINLRTNGNQATAAAQVAYRSDVHPHDGHATQNGCDARADRQTPLGQSIKDVHTEVGGKGGWLKCRYSMGASMDRGVLETPTILRTSYMNDPFHY